MKIIRKKINLISLSIVFLFLTIQAIAQETTCRHTDSLALVAIQR